jgi:CheY-like chemotaxis protein
VDHSHPLHTHLVAIRTAVERSTDLTRQLLAFARKQAIAPTQLDLNETVSGMLNMLRQLIGEQIALDWRPGAELWPIRMDPSQVDQILVNVCINARDAIADVGTVTIETSKIAIDAADLTDHQWLNPGEYLLLSVSDDGSGMDKQTRERAFEPFFTTKESSEGTGLGLATVYGIVKQNDGFVSVYSEPGQGTTFKIYFPRDQREDSPMQNDAPTEPTQGGYETTLLVEDDPALLEMTTKMLERQGYEVLSAPTPVDAVRLAETHHGEIDLLLTDVIMPEMNGTELAKRLAIPYPDIKCLFMSGYTASAIAHHGVLDEGVRFIQKPFTVQNLAAKVREALDCAGDQ